MILSTRTSNGVFFPFLLWHGLKQPNLVSHSLGSSGCRSTSDFLTAPPPFVLSSPSPHLFPSAMHNLLWDGVDLVMHLHAPPLAITHTHQQDPEVCSSKIQGQEVSFLWKMNPGQ